MTTKRATAIFQLNVTLSDVDPPIWRAVQVPENTKLPQLHRIFQSLFNWEDHHLHEFAVGRQVYGVPDPDDTFNERKVMDERLVPLNRILSRVGDTLEYVYDFGDEWRHVVLLNSILLPEPDVVYPRCVAGARNGPPEDAGGPPGYARYLEALADPNHEEHENMLAWRGRFDPEAFSIKAANAALAKLHRAPRARKASAAGAARHTQDLTKLMRLAAVEGRLTARIAKTRVAPGTALPLELTGQERELILNNSFAPYELTRRLRIVPQRGKPAVVRYNLEELDELAGYVASESNHTEDRKLHRQWQEIYDKIAAILDAYTDDEA